MFQNSEKISTCTVEITQYALNHHCEARVKKALEALPEVHEAVVSHETGTAVVTLNADVANETLKKAVEDQDYKVTGIE